MNELLALRYRLLFRAFWGSRILPFIWPKRSRELYRIKLYLEGKDAVLRPDAMLFLLILYEYMIIQPYTNKEIVLRRVEVPEIARDPARFSETVQISLDVIFKELEKTDERPISAHQVMRAIDKTWPELSRLFAWG
jgi:hypothetical protein